MFFTTGAQLSAAIAALPASKVGSFVAFDPFYYGQYSMASYSGSLSPIEHFVTIGAAKGAKPNATFDPAYYAAKYADLTGKGYDSADLLIHFLRFGLDEGRAPNATLGAFSATSYFAANPDVKTAVEAMAAAGDFNGSVTNGAIAHYVKFGEAEGRLTAPSVVPVTGGITFMVNAKTTDAGTIAVGEVMRLTGDQHVRIDFTDMANQVEGLDLDGKGTIANDGKENAITGVASNFEIVDAYSRKPLNETDKTDNFLGNISYDGTGYAGDGVKTNGNIFLGGLGADTAFGGIGNDFMVGGGVALARAGSDSLSGGRNADFFFVEMSALDNTDQNVGIDGGVTADDNSAGNTQSAMDADWLLFEGSDDNEPVTITLRDDTIQDPSGETATAFDVTGSIVARNGKSVGTLRDIENFDASGNLYGFLNNVKVQLGGRGTDLRDPDFVAGAANDGQGSSAQLKVEGSNVGNIIIGGYDNDVINGNGGNDLLMGGNLNKLLNPNLVNLVGMNDGIDVMSGGLGADNIVFEADGGIIEGDVVLGADDAAVDTLWLTAYSLGGTYTKSGLAPVPVAASAVTIATDPTLRFDLAVGKFGGLDNAAGYGGANKDTTSGYTADQTNYIADGLRVTVQDMENVIATGLGDVDYKAAGSNTADDQAFTNQQNFKAYDGALDLRGTDGANTLYASTGVDILEGRGGNDFLSGGDKIDKFIFGSANATVQDPYGDGIDVIWRQSDVNAADKEAGKGADNLWDGKSFEVDFGTGGSQAGQKSDLVLTITNTATTLDVRTVSFWLEGVKLTVTNADASLGANMGALAAALQTELTAKAPAGIKLTVDSTNKLGLNGVITITATPATDSKTSPQFVKTLGTAFVNTDVTVLGNTAASGLASIATENRGGVSVAGEQLIYKAYEDRLDNEAVNDNSMNGSTISLGVDSYAQDRVVSFKDADTLDATGKVVPGKVQTRIAEDQQYDITFKNLTTQDIVTITVNDVKYQLTVGKDLDGNSVPAEDGVGGDTQPSIQAAFLVRLNDFINSFMDPNTAAGKVASTLAGSTLTFKQTAYNNEQTVFMRMPEVDIQNKSGGELATGTPENKAQHEVLLYEYDGRNAGLNAANVRFIGAEDVSRSTLETATDKVGSAFTIVGVEATVIDAGTNNLVDRVTNTTANAPAPVIDPLTGLAIPAASIADNTNNNASLLGNYSVHGDDLLIGGTGNDTIHGRTGDDRVIGSLGTDTLDGGKSWYAVQVQGENNALGVPTARVVEMNKWESEDRVALQNSLPAGSVIASVDLVGQTQDGTTIMSDLFDDTLQFQQADFGNGKTANFTITLDAMVTAVGVPTLQFGGAGKVTVSTLGDGVVNGTTTFTNFENIRTVSGTSNAVANDGQGKDTLNIAALSGANTSRGVSYDLTNDTVSGVATSAQGEVRYSTDAITAAKPAEANFETVLIKVDGVENVITGTGNDLLLIDETEAAKDNTFNAGLNTVGGADRIEYENNYANGTIEATQIASVALPVGSLQAASLTADAGADNRAAGALAWNFLARAAAYTNDNNVDDAIAAAGATALAATTTEAGAIAALPGGTTAAAQAAVFAQAGLFNDVSEPTVTITLTGTAGNSKVGMTSGRVGSTLATDELTGVETITLANNTAQGVREDDKLDVSAYTAATVNYSTTTPTGAATTPRVTVGGVTQQVIENLFEVERVTGTAGADTVTVADAAFMSVNVRTDANTWDANIGFESFLNFDKINENLVTDRLTLVQLSQGTKDKATASAALPQVLNTSQFKFDLGNTAADSNDTVNYSLELGRIAAVVFPVTTLGVQSILVDGDNHAGAAMDLSNDVSDRIDLLTGVENVVASIGGGVIDLTGAPGNIKVIFSDLYDPNGASSWNGSAGTGYGQETHQIKVADGTSGTSLIKTNYIDYVYIDTNTADTITKAAGTVPADARWSSVEGSDFNDNVEVSGYEAGVVNTLNLRGGSNRVNYEGDKVEVTIDIKAFNAAAPATSGRVELTAKHTAPGDDHNAATLIDTPVFATDVITSYSAQNLIKAGELTVKGARGALDTISFVNGLDSKYFVLGGVVDATSAITVKIGSGGAANSLQMVGFETLNDAATNDAYDMSSIANVMLNMKFSDNATNDHDSMLLTGTDGVAAGSVIDLDVFAAAPAVGTLGMSMDFDVLDVLNTTTSGLTLDGRNAGGLPDATTDEVVVGALSKVTTVTNFESLVLTKASVAGGSSFTLNTSLDTLVQGATSVSYNGNVLSAGGLVFEGQQGTSYIDTYTNAQTSLNDRKITSGVTLNVTAVAAEKVTVVGSDSDDFLNGSASDDTLLGAGGNDTITAGITAEVRQFNITGVADAAATVGNFNFMAQNHIIVNEGAVPTVGFTPVAGVVTATVALGAGNDAVGAALAGAMNSNLAIVNTDWLAALGNVGSSITGVTYNDQTDQLNVTFAAGTVVTTAINFGAPNFGGSLALSTETATTKGGTGGSNNFRGGAGTDTLTGGAGTDQFVIVGTVSQAQADAYKGTTLVPGPFATQALVDAALTGATALPGAANVVNVNELIVAHTTTTDVGGTATLKEVINGGAGVDTLDIWGAADLTNTTITNIEFIQVHSTVTFTKAQLAAMVVLNFDSDTVIVVSDATSPTDAINALQTVSLLQGPIAALKVGSGETGSATPAVITNAAATMTNDNTGTVKATAEQLADPAVVDALKLAAANTTYGTALTSVVVESGTLSSTALSNLTTAVPGAAVTATSNGTAVTYLPVTGTANSETITGTAGVDSFAGAGGNDTFVLSGTQSIGARAGTTINAGDTFEFTSTALTPNPYKVDIITDFSKSGDDTLLRPNATPPASLNGNGVGIAITGLEGYIKGNYTSTAGSESFVASATGTSTMYIYDLDGVAGGNWGAVVLVGYVDTATPDGQSTGITGLTGFGG